MVVGAAHTILIMGLILSVQVLFRVHEDRFMSRALINHAARSLTRKSSLKIKPGQQHVKGEPQSYRDPEFPATHTHTSERCKQERGSEKNHDFSATIFPVVALHFESGVGARRVKRKNQPVL
jgi:hypothetical protein